MKGVGPRRVATRRPLLRWFWAVPVVAALVGVGFAAFASPAAESSPSVSAEVLRARVVAGTSAGGDPVVAAAGDIACDPTNSNFNGGNGSSNSCRQKAVSDLLVNAGYDAVLLLGDNQYYCGGYTAHLQSYDPSWGRVKGITKPAPGNHEYLTSGGTDCTSANAGADGYYRYFGAAAGERGKGYYSFDIGSWHVIVLNSHCSGAGGCSSSTPQGQWLRNELQTHSNVCTLAYWHVPLYSSGGRDSATYSTFWDALYQYNADLVLGGHDHTYERFAPQTPNGVRDNVRGIRQFVVGTGGANHTSFVTTMANSEVRDSDTYGVLRLTLRPTSYDWEFVPEAGKTFTDSGSQSCHGVSDDVTPPSTPTGLSASASAPGTVDLTWNASTDNRSVEGYRVYRNGSVIATVTGVTSYSDTTAAPATSYSYTVAAYDAGLNPSPQSAPAGVTTPPDTAAPSAPTNLSATFVGASEVRLAWTASTDNVGVQSYRVFRGGIEIGSASTPSYVDSSVQPQTSYSYFVRAYDGVPNVSEPSNTVSVITPPPPTVLTFIPAADASIRSDLPANNFGSEAKLGIDGSPIEDVLLKFAVSGVAGRSVESAKLRLYCIDAGGSGGVFKRAASSGWVESTVNWTTAPAAEGTTLASLGATTAGTWYEVDVTSLVTGDGVVSIRANGSSTNGTDYGSKEGAAEFAPQLVVTASSAPGGEPDGTPPSAPTNLAAAVISATRVDLTWTASSDNVAVTGYRIFRNGTQIATSTGASHSDATAQPNTSYDYQVRAVDAATNVSAGSNVATAVTPQATLLTFVPTADAMIQSAKPNATGGSKTTISVDSSPIKHSLLKFTVSGVGGRAVRSVRLRLYCTNPSQIGGVFARVTNSSWSEATVTWNTAPAAGPTIATLGSVALGTWYEVDLTSYITGDGTYTVRVSSTSADGADYSSREGTNPPQLLVDAP